MKQYSCYLCSEKCSNVQTNIEFGLPIVRCDGCGLLQTGRISESFLKKYYAGEYSDARLMHVSEGYLKTAARRGEDQKAFVEAVSGTTQFENVLDFGGGFGGALEAFPQSNKYLYEVDPQALEKLKAAEGVNLLGPAELESEDFRQFFDLIIVSHVLEHLKDPVLELERLQSRLKPGGYLFIEVPTEDETVLRLQVEAAEPGLGHIFHFELGTVRKLLEECSGYRVAETVQCGVDKIAFYKRQIEMEFGISNSGNGIWLRALLQSDGSAVEPKSRKKDTDLADTVLEWLYLRCTYERDAVKWSRKAYKELQGIVSEPVPSAEAVIGLEKGNLQKLFFLSEKARREALDNAKTLKQAVQANGKLTERVEADTREKKDLLRKAEEKEKKFQGERAKHQGELKSKNREYQDLLKRVEAMEKSTAFRLGTFLTSPLKFFQGSKKLDAKPRPVVESEAQKAKRVEKISENREDVQKFYENNGFALIQDVIPSEEARGMSGKFKSDLIHENVPDEGHTTFDIAAVHKEGRDYAFDPRVLAAVRNCLGDDIKFLQWATYQLNHMSFPWHRDGPFRQFGIGHDWDESQDPYKVAKIILYLDCRDFAMAVYPETHKRDIDRTQIKPDRDNFVLLEPIQQTADTKLENKPYLVRVKPGDALVFDQRLYHCGRLIDPKTGKFTKSIPGDKSFLSYTYGADNPHSYRFFAYFNRERAFNIKPMNDDLVKQLKDENLMLSTGQDNYFDKHPEQREHLWLPEAK